MHDTITVDDFFSPVRKGNYPEGPNLAILGEPVTGASLRLFLSLPGFAPPNTFLQSCSVCSSDAVDTIAIEVGSIGGLAASQWVRLGENMWGRGKSKEAQKQCRVASLALKSIIGKLVT
eukprot:1154661-Pelagomonas_calceolata.AAC.9